MKYYEVLVADNSFKGAGALTYASEEVLARGQAVNVPVKNRKVMGLISQEVAEPSFKTRELSPTAATQAVPSQLLDLAQWMMQYYPASAGETMQQFLPSKIYESKEFKAEALPEVSLPRLTEEQQAVVEAIDIHDKKADTYLLHGETGSGKTRVYIELALREFRAGRSCIILTPEIGLTPQLTDNFTRVFGAGNVITTHSQLTAKTRSLHWSRALESDKPLLVLGPRSALFMPLRNIGLIVLDESHESSYKQEQAPHYHANKVAATLAHLHGAKLVLGSATPLVTDYYTAEAKGKKILRMTAAAMNSVGGEVNPDDVTTVIVDLKDRKNFSRKPHLSDALLKSIETSLRHGEQSLVFLNRRGTARSVLCENCGWQAICPHCDLPLTYHGDDHILRCHTCGHITNALTSCPECGSPDILMKSIGTKALVGELQAAFPQASIRRFDTDNKKDERLEAHYFDLRDGNIDIVVGTQIVAKGLDLPKLSTVGVVVADTSLYLPDYTAQERTYQLLRQVIGRVGRGHRAGRIILQTYDPDSPVIKAAASNDETSWNDFYQAELTERAAFMFPPFCYTLKVWCRRASPASAEKAGEIVAERLQATGLRLVVDGPMPALHEKHGDQYQWQLNVKAKDRRQLTEAIKLLPANWFYDIDPSNLL